MKELLFLIKYNFESFKNIYSLKYINDHFIHNTVGFYF